MFIYLFLFCIISSSISSNIILTNAQLTPLTCYVDSSVNATSQCGLTVDKPCASVNGLFNSLLDQGYKFDAINATIQLAVGTYSGTDNSNIDIFGKTLNFIGAPASENGTTVRFDGLRTNRIFTLLEPLGASNTTQTLLNLDSITFTNGFAASGISPEGGGVLSAKITNTTLSVNIDNCNFTFSTSQKTGGAIHVLYLLPQNVQFDNANLSMAVVNINNSRFVSNQALEGGAIHAELTTLNIAHTQFISNQADEGAAISTNAIFDIVHSDFQENSANDQGGAILYESQHTHYSNIAHSTFSENHAVDGGAISCHQTQIHLYRTDFTENEAEQSGGAIAMYAHGSVVSATECTFNQNDANQGGAIYQDNESSFVLTNSNFTSNTAYRGGSMLFSYSKGSLTGILIESSRANQGAAIYTVSSEITFNNGTAIEDNVAGIGAFMYCSNSKITIPSPIVITNNTDTIDSSSASEEDGENTKNPYNIFCSLIPDYTYCTFSGDDDYTQICGEVEIPDKGGLPFPKVALAFIIIGGVVILGLISFGIGCLLARSTDKGDKNYAPVLDAMNTGINTSDDSASDKSVN